MFINRLVGAEKVGSVGLPETKKFISRPDMQIKNIESTHVSHHVKTVVVNISRVLELYSSKCATMAK